MTKAIKTIDVQNECFNDPVDCNQSSLTSKGIMRTGQLIKIIFTWACLCSVQWTSCEHTEKNG